MPWFKPLCAQWGIGLTGGIATGKSTVARMIAGLGVPVIDADVLAREVVAVGKPALAALVSKFGTDILHHDGSLDRPKLRRRIFADPRQRQDVEAITHPAIAQELKQRLLALGLDAAPRWWVYEASLILEQGRKDDFATIWATNCPPEVQIGRLCQRDGVGRADAEAAIAAQMPNGEKIRLADTVINTDRTESELTRDVAALVRSLLQPGR